MDCCTNKESTMMHRVRSYFAAGVAGVIALAAAPALGQGCCTPNSGKQASAPASDPPGKVTPAVLDLRVEGMCCEHSASAITTALKGLDGVRTVDISFERGGGVVGYDPARADPARIVEAVRAIKRMSGKGSYEAGRNLPAERVTLYEVPLVCPAAPQIGCGSLAKPTLAALEDNTGVAEAWLNRAGTVLAVVWTEGATNDQRAGAARLLADRLPAAPKEVAGAEREKRLGEFLRVSGWYRGAAVDRLSEHEAGVIAARLVRRVRAEVPLDDAKADALARAIEAAMKERFTDKSAAAKKLSVEQLTDAMIQAARPDLDEKGLAALRTALAAGLRPRAGEQ